MINEFARTLRSLEAERGQVQLLVTALALLAMAGWSAWMLLARIEVHAVSREARLQIATDPHPVQLEVSGRVRTVRAAVGDRVEAGQVLVELDTHAQELDLVQARAELEAHGARAVALEQRAEALDEAGTHSRRASRLTARVAQARRREAQAALDVAEEEHDRTLRIMETGSVPELEMLRLRGEQTRQRAVVEALRLEIDQLRIVASADEGERRALQAEVAAERVEARGAVARSEAIVRKLEHVIAMRLVRAPVSGRVGELAELTAGTVVEAGQRVGTVVPDGELVIVAQLPPAQAVGRLAPGQPATLRLDGFPWTSFGTIRGHVREVASEPREGLVRVEVAIDAFAPRIPHEHGLPGTLEVEVERVSPAALFLRAAGQLLAGEPPGGAASEGGP